MSMYSRGRASIERVNKLLTYKPGIVDGPIILSELRQVEVRNLILNPSQQTEFFILLSPGQTLGIVGTSGSFKSSLLTALYRRREIPRSCIFYNGHDINYFSLISIYQQVGVVTQEPSVFNRSIRGISLTFANPKASLHEVEGATSHESRSRC